jgi:hypothetical protein
VENEEDGDEKPRATDAPAKKKRKKKKKSAKSRRAVDTSPTVFTEAQRQYQAGVSCSYSMQLPLSWRPLSAYRPGFPFLASQNQSSSVTTAHKPILFFVGVPPKLRAPVSIQNVYPVAEYWSRRREKLMGSE